MENIREKDVKSLPGIPMVMLAFGFVGLGVFGFVSGFGWPSLVLILIGVVVFAGLYTIAPNQSVVLSLFGKYVGTADQQGLRWNNIFYS